MRFIPPAKRVFRSYLLSFLAWGLVAFVLGLNFVARGGGTWVGSIEPSVKAWLPWAVFTPLLVWLVDRRPLDAANWKRSAPLHLVCAIVIMFTCHWWKESSLFRSGAPGGFPPHARGGENAGRRFPPGPGSGAPHSPGPRGGPFGPPPPGGFFDLFGFVIFDLPIYLMLLTGAHAALFSRREQERTASLNRARLEALRMQLQPHFLFNTLNAISGLLHAEPDKADAMLVALSSLLRLSLETSQDLEWPLSRELALTERYLEIMHGRFEERLRYELEIAEGARDALVPPLLLQPLVENAVEHGLQPKPQGGQVRICAWREGASLHLSIADDGVGAPEESIRQEGVGLSNTRARLQELYGKRASFLLRNGDGVTVEIVLPYAASAPSLYEEATHHSGGR